MKKKPAHIAPILKSMAKNLGLETGIDLYLLKDQWADLIGDPIAAHTMPQAIRHHTLTLHVDASPWMHELTFLKEALRQKINTRLGKESIRSIRLKLGPILCDLPPKEETHAKKNKPLSREAEKLLQSELDSVSDHDLKRVIGKAMARHLQND